MREKYKTLLEKMLALLAKLILWRHKPHIIGITGSIGKTSTKDAIAHVLEKNYQLRKTYKNYNNEIGVPLTIIGAEAAGTSVIGWLRVGFAWVRAMLTLRYPEVLVLEYGIDRPGDMDVLMRIARPHVGVVTHVTSAHQEFFKDIAAIAHEKGKLAQAVQCQGSSYADMCGVVLNADDTYVAAMQKKLAMTVYTYSAQDAADFSVSDVLLNFREATFYGLSFKINYAGKSVPIRLPHVLAEHHVYAVLAAIAVGTICKMNLVDIATQLQSYVPPVSRMRYLKGKNDVVIVDDSYNASPHATTAALDTLAHIVGARKVVVFGDMLELGDIAHKSHRAIMRKVIAQKLDVVILVGKEYHACVDMLSDAGYTQDTNVFLCANAMDAARTIATVMRSGDVILVKGSQGMRMEKVVEKIVADDVDQKNAICRQNPQWKEKDIVPQDSTV